jgi:transposase
MGARSSVLRTGDGREIPRQRRAELDRLRRRLIMPFELGGRARPGGKSQAQDQACHWIVNLYHIRGLGENFAAVLTSEVLYDHRKIASYVSSTPMPCESGGMDRDRRISRAGDSRKDDCAPDRNGSVSLLTWQRAGRVVPRARRHAGRAHTAALQVGRVSSGLRLMHEAL